MQPLDRDNAQFRRDAAEMRTATLRQRAGIDEQRARMRVLHEASRWSMVEVLMVAATVSIVRIASMAHASPSVGMFAFGALALLLAALESGGLRHLWLELP